MKLDGVRIVQGNKARVALPSILRPANVRLTLISGINALKNRDRQVTFRINGIHCSSPGVKDVNLKITFGKDCSERVLAMINNEDAIMNLLEVVAAKERVYDETLRVRVSRTEEEIRVSVAKDSKADKYYVVASYFGGDTDFGILECNEQLLLGLLSAIPRRREIVGHEILTRQDSWQIRKGIGYKEIADRIGIPEHLWPEYGITYSYISTWRLFERLRHDIPKSVQLRPGDVRSPENCLRAIIARYSILGLVVKNEGVYSGSGALLE